MGETRYICFLADYLDEEKNESKEGNNTDYIAVTIEVPLKPDLIAQNASISKTTARPGETITFNVSVKNTVAGTTAGSFYIYYYFKKDSIDYLDTYVFTNDLVSSLAYGNVFNGSKMYTLPTNLQPGTYYFYYWIDATEVVSETSGSNNKGEFAITVSAPQTYPDLVVQSPSINPTSGVPGDWINAGSTVKNIGNAEAGGSVLGYYFSSDTTKDGSDIYLGSYSVPSLGGGGFTGTNTSVQIPQKPAGTYYILFVADDLNKVINESNEGNNVNYQQFIMKETPTVDLQPLNFSIVNSSKTYYSGDTIQVAGQV